MKNDTIYRQEALDAIERHECNTRGMYDAISTLPSAQTETDILSWLLAYHTKSFELHGRYLPHEVIGWLVHDFANAYMTERREE